MPGIDVVLAFPGTPRARLLSNGALVLFDSAGIRFDRRTRHLRFGRPTRAGFFWVQEIGVLTRVWEEAR